MNSKSSFSRRTWPLCSKRRKLFSSKRLSSIQKIHTAPFRATFVVNAMRRDLSPPLSSYFQGRLNRALLQSLLMRRPSNPPAKSKAQLCALLSNSRKRSTKVAQRLEHRAALPPSQLAFWLSSVFFLANLILLLKSVVFLEIAIVFFAMLVMCLSTRVLAVPTLKLAKNSCLTLLGISSSGNTRARGGIALLLTALAVMQWTAPKSACAASPQSEARLESQLALQVQAPMDGAKVLGRNSSDAKDRDEKAKASLAEFTAGAKYSAPIAADLKVVAFDYVLLGDYLDADKWLTKMLEWTPDDAQGWYYLGRTKYNENRFAEAISAFEQCLKVDPKNVKAEDNLGLSYAGLGQNEQAAAAYQTAIAWQSHLPAKNPGPYIDLGSLLLDENKPDEAIANLLQAVEISLEIPKRMNSWARPTPGWTSC